MFFIHLTKFIVCKFTFLQTTGFIYSLFKSGLLVYPLKESLWPLWVVKNYYSNK